MTKANGNVRTAQPLCVRRNAPALLDLSRRRAPASWPAHPTFPNHPGTPAGWVSLKSACAIRIQWTDFGVTTNCGAIEWPVSTVPTSTRKVLGETRGEAVAIIGSRVGSETKPRLFLLSQPQPGNRLRPATFLCTLLATPNRHNLKSKFTWQKSRSKATAVSGAATNGSPGALR